MIILGLIAIAVGSGLFFTFFDDYYSGLILGAGFMTFIFGIFWPKKD